MKNRPDKLAQAAVLVVNDSGVTVFGSINEYRAEVLKGEGRPDKALARLLGGPPSCDSSCCIARQVTPSAGGGV